MKRFLLQIAGFILVFCLVQWVLYLVFPNNLEDTYKLNPQFTAQFHHYLLNRDQYNTVFMGSSRTYRQIDPEVIDTVLQSIGTKSYNLGAHATFIPEYFALFDLFLDHQPDTPAVRYVFMELTGINNIKFANWYAPKSFYFLDLPLLTFVWKTHFSNPDLSLWRAISYTLPYVQGYVLKQLLPLVWMSPKPIQTSYSGEKGNGYYALDNDLEQNQTLALQVRRGEFLKDTNVLAERLNKMIRSKAEHIPPVFADQLDALVRKASAKGIELYFIIPPKLKYYSSLATLRHYPVWDRVIDMGDFSQNKDLQIARYNFDDGHFNGAGAAIYSQRLAQQMKSNVDWTYISAEGWR